MVIQIPQDPGGWTLLLYIVGGSAGVSAVAWGGIVYRLQGVFAAKEDLQAHAALIEKRARAEAVIALEDQLKELAHEAKRAPRPQELDDLRADMSTVKTVAYDAQGRAALLERDAQERDRRLTEGFARSEAAHSRIEGKIDALARDALRRSDAVSDAFVAIGNRLSNIEGRIDHDRHGRSGGTE